MKRLSLFLFGLIWLAGGAAGRPLDALPPTVFLVVSPRQGHPDQTVLYQVTRGKGQYLVVFSDRALASKFASAAGASVHQDFHVQPMARSTITEYQKAGASFVLDPTDSASGGESIEAPQVKDNEELKEICDSDQADRRPAAGKEIDWAAVEPRDKDRLTRVMALYRAGKLVTAPDYFRAALVLQHGVTPDDYLLAHELAIVAVRKGNDSAAAWLAAASEDRFLRSIGRKQRFGTQLSNPIVVDGAVTDTLRGELNVPALQEEEKQAKELAPSANAKAASANSNGP